MPTVIKGTAPCPECGNTQSVKHDGRKYFITCTDCRTMTSYQSKAAKERIEKRLKPIDPKPETDKKIEFKDEGKPKPPPTPVRTTGGFFEALNDLF